MCQKLEALRKAESGKDKAENEYLAAEKLASAFSKLKEYKNLSDAVAKLTKERDAKKEKLAEIRTALKAANEMVENNTKAAAQKDYAGAADTHKKTASELDVIEKKLVETLVQLLYEFSDDGIINLKDMSLDSDKAAKWASSFEHSEFKTLVQQSGTLKSTMTEAKKQIAQLEQEYPYLAEGKFIVVPEATAAQLRAEAQKQTLAAAKMETEISTLEKDCEALNANISESERALSSVAEEVIGIRPSYDHFATMHIMNTKKGVYFLADTMINKNMDTDTLVDVARLARIAVEYFAKDPVMAMVSYSNFGADKANSPRMVHDAVAVLHERYPDLLVDGEMQINYALNKTIRDKNYPFNKLNGKDVNTLIFPNLSAASSAYRIMLEMGLAEFIGPIQIGLNKPVHFISVEASVRDIVNLATIASIDATACEKGNSILDK